MNANDADDEINRRNKKKNTMRIKTDMRQIRKNNINRDVKNEAESCKSIDDVNEEKDLDVHDEHTMKFETKVIKNNKTNFDNFFTYCSRIYHCNLLLLLK